MGGFEGIIVLFVIVSVVSSIIRAAKNSQQSGGSSGANDPSGTIRPMQRSAPSQRPAAAGSYTGSITSAQRERLEQLRRLQQERSDRMPSANPSGTSAAKPADRPVYPHSGEDCTGGSLHDGYHEGTIRPPARPANIEGSTGKQGVSATEESRLDRPLAAASAAAAASRTADAAYDSSSSQAKQSTGADKLAKAIAAKPAIVQGMIWSEVLGKPLSDG
ncbi:MAG: hypothetical protein IKI64_03065 [Clostridia bacterium]|nr:hypothetical protein [Clostridia bacterium]